MKRPRPVGGGGGTDRGRLQLERIGGLLELRHPNPLGGMVRTQTITVRMTADTNNSAGYDVAEISTRCFTAARHTHAAVAA